MAEHILSMVRTANPEAIQKYVKYHLPNDQASLQRIYKELLQYNAEPKLPKDNKSTKRSQSLQSLHSVKPSQSSMGNQGAGQGETKRTNNLIRILKEKGLKVTNDSEEKGMELFISQRQKMIKPLITNSKLLKTQEAQIDRLIHRFSINSEYYSNRFSGSQKKVGRVDGEMGEFFDRRQAILDSIKNKTNQNIINNPMYNYVSAKVYQSGEKRSSFQQIPSLKKSEVKTARLTRTSQLLGSCNLEVKSQKFKTVGPKDNYFRDLDQKLKSQESPQGELAYLQIASAMIKNIPKQQYQRYTSTYMSMLTDKIKSGSKCKLSKYDKDLIQDEKRMRKIISSDLQ